MELDPLVEKVQQRLKTLEYERDEAVKEVNELRGANRAAHQEWLRASVRPLEIEVGRLQADLAASNEKLTQASALAVANARAKDIFMARFAAQCNWTVIQPPAYESTEGFEIQMAGPEMVLQGPDGTYYGVIPSDLQKRGRP